MLRRQEPITKHDILTWLSSQDLDRYFHWGNCKEVSEIIHYHLSRIGIKNTLIQTGGRHYYVIVGDWVIDTVLWKKARMYHYGDYFENNIVFDKKKYKKMLWDRR